ncbi:MAG: hypothetical protein LCH46_11845 [Proteobacteria bacterium]|nr:hypothetical protein [Pseudomonadota bacterium]
MSQSTIDLDQLVQDCRTALASTEEGGPCPPETTMRERFFELLVLSLGNLYNKTPVAAALFDRTTMLRVTTGMDDNDAGKLTGRGEDWLRLEGIFRQQDGQKAYYLTRPALAVLSTITSTGTLGDVLDALLLRYQQAMPTPEIRKSARMLGAYFLSRVARS